MAYFPFDRGSTVFFRRKSMHIRFVIVLLALFCCTNSAVAWQNESTLRPVFDESFDHWPVELKINGRIILNRGLEESEPVDRLLRRITKDEKVVLFSPEKDDLGSRLESLSEEDDCETPDCETAALETALENSDTIYLAANCFSAKELVKLKDPFKTFIERGGNLLADASLGEVFGSVHSDNVPGLNLIPDCYINSSFDDTETSKQQLIERISKVDPTVGIGIEPDTMLIFSGRRIFSLGDGSSTLAIRGSELVPATFQKIGAQRSGQQRSTADLTQWRRMAIDRSLPPFPVEKPKSPFVEKGSLFIIGGGGMPKGLMKQMIEAAGGTEKAKIVCIPCSESDEVGRRQSMVRMWKRFGVENVTFLHTKDRNKANSDDAFLEPLKDATLLWFGGGRQWNFADSYYGTEAHKLMKEVLHRGGVIGGSSAGASIQGRFLARATPIGNSNILAPGYERGGLGFLSGVAIDQHFSQRRRQKDMTGLVEKYPQLLGIGLDETTAIIVQKSRAEVVGPGKVYFYDRSKPTEEGKPDYTALPEGGVYDLLKREVIDLSK